MTAHSGHYLFERTDRGHVPQVRLRQVDADAPGGIRTKSFTVRYLKDI